MLETEHYQQFIADSIKDLPLDALEEVADFVNKKLRNNISYSKAITCYCRITFGGQCPPYNCFIFGRIEKGSEYTSCSSLDP